MKNSLRLSLPIAVLFLSLAIFSCKSKTTSSSAPADIETLKGFMVGSYDSSEQAARDSSYFNISLHMYPIWTQAEGHWLYVEQALASMQEKPYRQRVYGLEKTGDNIFVSKVYEMPDPKAAIGKWKEPKWFDQWSPADLTEKEGCGVHLKWEEGMFKGATGEKTCQSSLRGASYATSRVTVHSDRVVSWDQGWDDNGEQVWGAEKGGYEFIKIK